MDLNVCCQSIQTCQNTSVKTGYVHSVHCIVALEEKPEDHQSQSQTLKPKSCTFQAGTAPNWSPSFINKNITFEHNAVTTGENIVILYFPGDKVSQKDDILNRKPTR